jgi:hypothetical protein
VTVIADPGSDADCKYWAFISYSHHDERWARWLHRALETYRIPKQLAPRAAAIGAELPNRVYPVFLDRDELSGGFDLSKRITNALEQSRFLIVICSPHAVASRYVQEEIDAFENLGREDRVLCLIVDGEPGASGRPESGLQECLPAPVRTRRTPRGELVPCEPLAADARKAKDGRHNAKLKILAELLGVDFDELKNRAGARLRRHRVELSAGWTRRPCGVQRRPDPGPLARRARWLRLPSTPPCHRAPRQGAPHYRDAARSRRSRGLGRTMDDCDGLWNGHAGRDGDA